MVAILQEVIKALNNRHKVTEKYGVPSVLMKRNKKTMDREPQGGDLAGMNYWTSYKCATYKIWAKFNYPRYKSSPLFYNRQAQLIINGRDLLSKHFVPGILNHLKKIKIKSFCCQNTNRSSL